MDFWVLLVIRMNHGQYIAVPMKEEEARTTVHDWLEGKMGPSQTAAQGIYGRAAQIMPDGSHMAWGVLVEEIVLMHTAPYEEKQTQEATPTRGKANPPWAGNPWRKSGN